MTPKSQLFHTYTPSPSNKKIAVANGSLVTVEYIKEQHLYRILVPSTHILLSFCIRIGAFDRSRVFVLVQVFRVPCTLLLGFVSRERM